MTKKTALFLFLLTVASCTKLNSTDNTEKENIRISRWLLGSWENKSNEGDLKETWTKINDSTFLGESYFIKANDTIHFETIKLQQIGDNFSYTTTIKGENEDNPVGFGLIKITEKELAFENKNHDYPQKISYSHTNNDSFELKITGKQLKKESQEQYLMTKIK